MASSTHESMRTTLQDALHAARNAVLFDDRGLTADAMQAYGDACALLGQVMRKPLESVDREKVETIRTTYIKRIYELQGGLGPMSPRFNVFPSSPSPSMSTQESMNLSGLGTGAGHYPSTFARSRV